MFTWLKKLIKPATSLVSLRFIVSIFLMLLLSAGLLMVIFSWLTGTLLETTQLQEEAMYTKGVSATFDDYLQHGYDQLSINFDTSNQIYASLENEFDIGVIQYRNTKQVSLDANPNKFQDLLTFASSINAATPHYTLDTTNNLIYITYLQSSTNYEIGAIDLTGSAMTNLIASNTFHTYLVSTNGTIILTNTSNINPTFIQSLKIAYNNEVQIKIGNIRREAFTYYPIDSIDLGIAALSDPVTITTLQYSQTFFYYILLLGFSIFLALIVLFALLIDIPLTRLVTFFADYNKGKVRHIEHSDDGSFGIITENINKLIGNVKNDVERINKADEIQDDFLLLSGHLLRTPLTSIKGYLDIVVTENKDEKLVPTLSSIELTLNKLVQLEENILAISKDNDNIINAPTSLVYINELLEEIHSQTVSPAQEKKINYILDTLGIQDAAVTVNRDNLTRAIKNLIDNAVKFTSEGGTVKLYAQIKKTDVIISVSDTGIGLTKEETEGLFKKFSRISDTMEYNSDGFGIGLYVAKLIVERYGGIIWVDSIKGSGSIFNIKLPIANE